MEEPQFISTTYKVGEVVRFKPNLRYKIVSVQDGVIMGLPLQYPAPADTIQLEPMDIEHVQKVNQAVLPFVEGVRSVRAITGITCENGETILEYEWVPVARLEPENKVVIHEE